MPQLTWVTSGALLLLGLILAAPTPATAQETPGYDPDTPAGVEYQLPLPRTRREAAGRSPDDRRVRGSGPAAKPVPLFGVGAGGSERQPTGGSPASSRDRSGQPREADANGRRGSDRGARPKSKGSDEPNGPAQNTAGELGDSPLQLGLTGGVLLVLAGAVVGIAVRLRGRRGAPDA